MNATTKTIYVVLQHGPRSVMELRRATSKGDNYVRECLAKLEALGKVRRDGTVRANRKGPNTHLWRRIA